MKECKKICGQTPTHPHRWFGDPEPQKRCICCGVEFTDQLRLDFHAAFRGH